MDHCYLIGSSPTVLLTDSPIPAVRERTNSSTPTPYPCPTPVLPQPQTTRSRTQHLDRRRLERQLWNRCDSHLELWRRPLRFASNYNCCEHLPGNLIHSSGDVSAYPRLSVNRWQLQGWEKSTSIPTASVPWPTFLRGATDHRFLKSRTLSFKLSFAHPVPPRSSLPTSQFTQDCTKWLLRPARSPYAPRPPHV